MVAEVDLFGTDTSITPIYRWRVNNDGDYSAGSRDISTASGDFACPLKTGSNLVGGEFPVDVSPADRPSSSPSTATISPIPPDGWVSPSSEAP